MSNNSQDIINEINFTKRCILIAAINKDKNLILINSFQQIPIVKLYTADTSFENFIYSKIKGAFCLLMSKEKDIKNRKYFFRIYSVKDYSLLFNMEVKKEYIQYITQYKQDFYFMELHSSFLGFKFLSNNSARIFFLLLKEDPNEEVIKQNEAAQNINTKNISKTLNKVTDNIKSRLKNKFENNQGINTTYKSPYANNRRNISTNSINNNFSSLIVNEQKGEYLDTSDLPEIEILLNNLEIDENNTNCYLFTEKKLNLKKCKEIVKSHQINSTSKYKRRSEQNIPITIIEKDIHTIGNIDLYTEIMTKNMINTIQTQKQLDIFLKEYRKRNRLSGLYSNQLSRKTKGRLNKINSARSPYLSKINDRFSLNQNSSSEKIEAKSVEKENSGKFADNRREINSMVETDVFKEMDDEDDNDYNNKIKDNKNANANNKGVFPRKKEYFSMSNFLMSKK